MGSPTKRNASENGRPFTIAVEGNIGSGKTTFINLFSQNPDIQIYFEPVEKWCDLEGHNLLGLMYKNPERWSLSFQSYVQLTMLEIHTQKQSAPIKMMERSLFSARYCFVENLFRTGKMPLAEYLILDRWFQWLISSAEVHVDLIVYLRTDPDAVFERVQGRSRPEEKAMLSDYLHQLNTLHEDWLFDQKRFPLPCPVIILDANCDLKDVQELCSKAEKQISDARKAMSS